MNKKLILSLLGMSLFPIINTNLIFQSEASNISKTQEDLSPLITYTSEKIGDREKMRVTVTVEDRSGSGIKEFRDYNNKLINGNSYTFEIIKRGNYIFTAVDNNNTKSTIVIDDSWINPYSKGILGRELYGSSYWSSSNLREWLNSYQERVEYTCNPPSKEFIGNNSYNEGAGFLNEFTNEELEAIAITERKIQISSSLDELARDGGGKADLAHINMYLPTFLANLHNYAFNFQNMPYKIEKDKVFILNIPEIYWYLIQRGESHIKSTSSYAKNKYNLSEVGWWVQWSSPWSSRDRNLSTSLNNKIFYQDNEGGLSGVAPAIHIKPDYIFQDGRSTRDLNILDIVEFGRYKGEAIEWKVINITDEGYILLQSNKVLDYKKYDAKGDQSRVYSDYVKYKEHDVSLVDSLQFKSNTLDSDINIPTVNIINENALNVRHNNGYSIELEFIDNESGIDYIITPEGNKVFDTKITYNIQENGNKIFTIKDNAGNYVDSLIPINNINQSPEVHITQLSNEWSTEDVYIDINTSNEVVWRANSFKITPGKSGVSRYSFPNYTAYNGANFKISGRAKLTHFSEEAKNISIGFGMIYYYKVLNDFGYSGNMSENLQHKILLSDLKLNEWIPFEFIYTVPDRYSHGLATLISSGSSTLDGNIFEVEISNLTYELISSDTSDFYIDSIVLPNGNIISNSNYTDTITKEGINTWTYKVLDSRGKETVKTITTKIDKTSPTLNLDYNTNVTNQNISVNISASDATSGVKRIKLPNGNYITNSNSTYTISGDGEYIFECEDVAGNITTKTITINNIDKEKPNVIIDKNNTEWTNQGVQININTRD